MSVVSKMQSPKDVARDTGRTLLIYGINRVGKTHMLSTAYNGENPERKILYIDIDGGADAFLRNVDPQGAKVIEARTYSQIIEIADYLHEGNHPFGWVLLDSVTILGDHLLEETRKRERVNERGETEIWYVDKEGFDEWGAYGNQMIHIATRFRDLKHKGIWVVFTGLATSHSKVKTAKTELSIMLPGVRGKRAPEPVMNCFDVIAYMEKVQSRTDDNAIEIKRVLSLEGSDEYVAGDRTGALSDLEIPDLSYLRKKIENHVRGES